MGAVKVAAPGAAIDVQEVDVSETPQMRLPVQSFCSTHASLQDYPVKVTVFCDGKPVWSAPQRELFRKNPCT
jgi:hypothetical protein